MSLSVGPVPEGWYEQLADECRANGIEVDVNEYGTPVSVHHCPVCGHRYTVCPPSPGEGSIAPCATPECASYDPSRDARIYFAPDDPDLIES
jgi:hypothetical protein